jgi:hypothetical protein
MSRTRWFRILATAAAFVLGTAGAGLAKPLLQEDFKDLKGGAHGGEVVKTGDSSVGWRGTGVGVVPPGKGGFLSYDVKLNPEGGTIEFDFQRDERGHIERFVNFVNAGGATTLSILFEWPGFGHPEYEELLQLMANTPDSYVYYGPYRGEFNLMYTHEGLPVSIPKGKTTHVAVTWTSTTTKLYINGKELKSGHVRYPALMSALARTAVRIYVGGAPLDPGPSRIYSTPHSVISNFQVHDTALDPTQLGKPIAAPVAITAVAQSSSHGAGFSGKLVAGDKLDVAVNGTPGAKGVFDVVYYPDIQGKIDLDWRGYGVYLEQKAFFEANEINLRDVTGYRVYASTVPLGAVTAETPTVATLKVGEQSYTLEHLEVDTPHYVAVYAEKRDGTLVPVMGSVEGVPLAETAPGVYTGVHTLGYRDRFVRAVVVGRLSNGSTTVSMVDTNYFTTDPSLTLTVGTSPSELKADEKSTSQITVTVTDANGNAVSGHKVRFLLATTSQYTGVVGGGAFTEQVGGAVKEDHWGETDLFGRVSATYVAGFAAKTAIIVARDMVSSDTGAGWVKTYIQTGAELELTPVEPPTVAAAGYDITITSSDEWLTADGKSQARITAKVTMRGKPVEGHKISFGLSSSNGTVRAVSDVTDRNGEARALYTAGKKIGIVLVTATDTVVNISASVQIELRSDAPAKIVIQIKPEKLPADGHSTADITVLVTDINGNPNDNTEVEYRLASGGGRLREDKGLTDRSGSVTTEYVSGRTAGKAVFEITVRSTVPSAEELVKARDLALAVADFNFF